MKTPLYLFILICISSAISQNVAAGNNDNPRPQSQYKTESNDCNQPTSQYVLDINNVRTRLLDAGDMWFNPTTSTSGYEVPKADSAYGILPRNAIFAGAIWISGLDQGNNLKIAAELYRSTGSDFYSGPLDNNGNTILATCNLWDRHFPVWASQIRPVIDAYQNAINAGGTPGSITLSISTISDSVKFWPSKGNPYLTALGYDMSSVLAPFYDADGDGSYDPAHGDYPTIKHGGINAASLASACGTMDSIGFSTNTAYADEMIFWVTNDKGNTHSGTAGGVPIGVQINSLAFAFQTADAINNMTFYRHQFINKSGTVLSQTYLSQFTDPDLGCPNNDRAGCDTSHNMAFVYNGAMPGESNTPGYTYVADDGQGALYCNGSSPGYHGILPVLGIALIETPSDTTSIGSAYIAKQLGMTAFETFVNTNSPVGNPSTGRQFRNYQKGLWRDGTPITINGDGYQNTTTQTTFMYPGDPSIATEWSECNSQVTASIFPGDRRFVQTSGPFTFLPCASQIMTVAVLFVPSVTSNCPGFSNLSPDVTQAEALARSGYRMAATTGVADILSDPVSIYPNPVLSNLMIDGKSNRIETVEVYDVTGQLVMTQKGNVQSLDMAKLPEGMYMVRANAGGKETTVKVVKR